MPSYWNRLMACSAVRHSIALASLLIPGAVTAQVDFARDIRPILSSHCWKCHGIKTQMSGLRLDSREAALRGGVSGVSAVVPGDPASSVLLARVTHPQPSERMPPAEAPLSERQVAMIRRWIEGGAHWPNESGPGLQSSEEQSSQHWAFRRLRDVPLPEVSDRTWIQTPVDRFVLARLESKGVAPNGGAPRSKLIRRLHFDLIGLPPTADQVDGFVHDQAPGAYERLVDSLLEDRHFGERWARHWLDVARYADSAGYEEDRPRPDAYHYRDFLIRAFNADMPFDEFLKLQLAGDLLEPNDPQTVAATGFLTAGPDVRPDFVNFRKKDRFDELDDIISTIGTAMLGLTLGCARCHDHKYDPIPTADYYRLLAFFDQTERYGHPASPSEGAQYYELLAEFESRFEPAKSQLDKWVKARTEPIRLERISGLDIPEREKELLRAPEDKANALQASLLVQFSEELKVTDEQLRESVNEEDRAEWDSMSSKLEAIEASKPSDIARVLGIREGEPRETRILVRGDPDQEADRVEPQVLGSLTCDSGRQQGSRSRTDLAAWMTDVDCGAGALVARVIVNRLWQHHLGRGLVGTPGDFGARGDSPSHPDLLEWLSAELVRADWRLKPIHRLIVQSATYRQSGTWDESRAGIDSGNHLLWRREAIRLEAEAIRDAILAVSGTLNRTSFGPSVKPRIPTEAIYNPVESYDQWPEDVLEGPSTWRRSLYVFTKRANLFPFLELFGAPRALGSCARREVSMGPIQALAFMNDEFVREQSRYFAERVLLESAAQTEARIRTAYHLSLGRFPATEELARALSFLEAQTAQYTDDLGEQAASHSQHKMRALVDFCQSLFTSNEFLYVD